MCDAEGHIEVTCDDCIKVMDSWERLRRMEGYQEKLGVPVFTKFLELEPDSKGPLQITQVDIDNDSDHYRYLNKTYFDMIDQSIEMLGPDLTILIEDLEYLGLKHATFGVKPGFFLTLGEATFYGLEKVAKEEDQTMDAWKRVYGFLATHMIVGNMRYKPKPPADAKKSAPVYKNEVEC